MKEYTVDDVVERGKNEFNITEYSLAFQMPSGKKLAIKGSYPESLVNSANQMIESESNSINALAPYKEAVEHLSHVALTQSGSGAYASAQVLLSSYNGTNYQLDVSDLCHLDQTNFRYAQALIDGRVKTSREPQNVIGNGDEIFTDLEAKWTCLHVKNRYLS